MRIRPILQFLLSSVAFPAVAGDYSVCFTATDSLGCIIEQAEFARQRNAEINASIARVDRERARELALSLTHCKTWHSRTPRCLAERADRFAAHQNELIEASVARVAAARAFDAARRAEIAASMAAAAQQRNRRLEAEQKALIEASIVAVNAERERRFAAQQNALAAQSVARVEAERHRQLALQLLPCTSDSDARPRCQIERAQAFAAQQNALATASVQRVAAERERAFAAARNAEAERSMAAVAAARISSQIETASVCQNQSSTAAGCTTREAAADTAQVPALSSSEYAALTSHCVRAPESPRCDAEKIREFAAARNAEIERSLAAVAAARSNTVKASALGSGHPASFCAHGAANPACSTARERVLAQILDACRSAGYSSSGCNFDRLNTADAAEDVEIKHSLGDTAAANAASAGRENDILAHGRSEPGISPLETGAISLPPQPNAPSARFDRQSELRLNISNDPCQVSTRQFEAIKFSRGATIETNEQPELDRLATMAQTCPGMRIEVHGYADGGSHYNNGSLSQARAEAVTDYLVAAGVAPNRVAAIGRGGKHPVLPYSKGAESAFGGRAELVIRDPSTDAAARRVMWDLAELLDPTYIPAVANLSP